jgi:hypothetical protein
LPSFTTSTLAFGGFLTSSASLKFFEKRVCILPFLMFSFDICNYSQTDRACHQKNIKSGF